MKLWQFDQVMDNYVFEHENEKIVKIKFDQLGSKFAVLTEHADLYLWNFDTSRSSMYPYHVCIVLP